MDGLENIVRNFPDCSNLVHIHPYGNGHINDTYLGTYEQNGARIRYIHQRINRRVFKQPVLMIENIQRVTDHIHEWYRTHDETDMHRRTLRLCSTHEGKPYHLDSDGDFWRTYRFIEQTVTHEKVETPEQAHEAGQIVGQFHKILSDFPEPPLHVTIENFHNTPWYFESFINILKADVMGRAQLAGPEIEFILQRQELANVLIDLKRAGVLPVRITHNDTKMNNILMDEHTGRALCIIDLDTVMRGLTLHDFGDLVRTATNNSGEDESDCSKVWLRLPIYEALLEGYLKEADDMLTDEEKKHLTLAGRIICLEQGIRFLMDYLNGDRYYKTHRDRQNLERCRTQLKMVESIEAQEDEMNRLLYDLTGV